MKTNSGIFCSFLLGNTEFALAVENVREVVTPPAQYTHLPLAPDYLLGMFNLRGLIIPVVDLHAVLKIHGPKSREGGQKIAIVECGPVLIGLIFDATCEVFRSHNEEQNQFGYAEEARHVIKGAFKLEEGKRIIQVIDPDALFKLEHIPHQNNSGNRTHALNAKKRGLRKQCISFFTGPSRCALSIDSIQEILKIENLKGSLMTGDHCLGTIDLRGNLVPVIDFASLLGYREPDQNLQVTNENRRVVVMRLEKELFGLLVDSIESIVSYFNEELLSFPILTDEKKKLFTGCISRENEADIILLDHREIFTHDEIHRITQGHSKIYQASDTRTKDGAKKAATQTFITFLLESVYAVNIGEVREIIELPPSFLHPPGLPSYFCGVLNLRGDLVTIVDTRKMYGISQYAEPHAQRVLIFESQGGKFGLVVDAVESIVSFSENNRMRLPEMFFKSLAGSMSSDVQEVFEVTVESQKKTVLILNMSAISNRISQAHAA